MTEPSRGERLAAELASVGFVGEDDCPAVDDAATGRSRVVEPGVAERLKSDSGLATS